MAEKYFYPLDIDFTQLREQKSFLLELMVYESYTEEEHTHCAGLIHMIDAVQDYAVDNNFLTEKEVFGDLDGTD